MGSLCLSDVSPFFVERVFFPDGSSILIEGVGWGEDLFFVVVSVANIMIFFLTLVLFFFFFIEKTQKK